VADMRGNPSYKAGVVFMKLNGAKSEEILKEMDYNEHMKTRRLIL
jgi:hypothetical protein